MLGERKLRNVLLGLLEGVEHGAVRLPDWLVQILPGAFLLDHNLCLGNVAVDKTGRTVQLHLIFKRNELLRLGNTENIA